VGVAYGVISGCVGWEVGLRGEEGGVLDFGERLGGEVGWEVVGGGVWVIVLSEGWGLEGGVVVEMMV